MLPPTITPHTSDATLTNSLQCICQISGIFCILTLCGSQFWFQIVEVFFYFYIFDVPLTECTATNLLLLLSVYLYSRWYWRAMSIRSKTFLGSHGQHT